MFNFSRTNKASSKTRDEEAPIELSLALVGWDAGNYHVWNQEYQKVTMVPRSKVKCTTPDKDLMVKRSYTFLMTPTLAINLELI